MILQGKEESSDPQLPNAAHTYDKAASSDPSHEQRMLHTSDIDPPPYSNLDPNNPSSASGSAVVPVNAITLNTIRLEKLSDSITGKYYIVPAPTDSSLKLTHAGTYIIDPSVSQDEPSSLQDFVAKHSVLGLGKTFDFLSTPHAIFRSRFGSISLTLATKGSSERCHRAIVNVSTHHGDITVDLVSNSFYISGPVKSVFIFLQQSSIHPGKYITLKVTSHRGMSFWQ